jgi:hypothetical protein
MLPDSAVAVDESNRGPRMSRRSARAARVASYDLRCARTAGHHVAAALARLEANGRPVPAS